MLYYSMPMMMTSPASPPLCFRALLFAVGGLVTVSLLQTISMRGAVHSAKVIQRFWRRRGPSSSTRAIVAHFKLTGLSLQMRLG